LPRKAGVVTLIKAKVMVVLAPVAPVVVEVVVLEVV
jgi:hypothetical protein